VPPRYSIEVRPAASKMLPKLDPPVSRRVLAAIHRLADDPRPAGVKALVGSPGLLRPAWATTGWSTPSRTATCLSSSCIWLAGERSTAAVPGDPVFRSWDTQGQAVVVIGSSLPRSRTASHG
jgi:hypothetical protein